MNTFRYVMAVLTVIGLPPGLLYWFLIHPFAGFWRGFGPRWTFTIVGTVSVLAMIGLWLMRDLLVGRDLGLHYGVLTAGVVTFMVALWMAIKRKRYLTFKILAGVPEVTPGSNPGKLLTEGPYALIRNPRYIEVILGTFAYALVANYGGAYVVAVLSIPAVYVLVLIEEAELRDRFGAPYIEYCGRVPRFIPDFRKHV